ncbi:MAG: hypothetical protein L0229_09630, partial [Blastocatellia bacterium]|nr:hypothetical protein [Blastocatellia bacterium]
MKFYNSFLIRCWLIKGEPQGERSVFDAEHIQTGNHIRTESLTEINERILKASETPKVAEVYSARHGLKLFIK